MSSPYGWISPPSWGAPATGRWQVRGGLASDMAGGSLLVVVWVLLWAFFVLAVVLPAAGLHGTRNIEPAMEVEVAAASATSRR